VVPASSSCQKVNFAAWASKYPDILVGSTLVSQIASSAHQDNIVGEQLARFRAAEASAVSVCSSILSVAEKAQLDKWSIPYSKFPHGRVPHPILKALENHRNVNTLPHYLRGRVNVVSMKVSKVRALRARCPNADIRVYNPVITPADIIRFTDVDALPPHAECDMILFDDCLHHLSPSLVAAYVTLWNAKRVLGTMISPPESWERLDSMLPDVYSLQYPTPDSYLFLPADNESASYEQKFADNHWYDLGSFTVGNVDYDVENLVSYGPYHLLSISVNSGVTVRREYRTFDGPRVIRLPDFGDGQTLRSPWFPTQLFIQGIFHAGSIRKLGTSDVLARLRGLAATDVGRTIPLPTWERFSSCCILAGMKLRTDPEVLVVGSFMDRLLYRCMTWCRTYCSSWFFDILFPHYAMVERARAALSLETLHFTVPLRHDVEFDSCDLPVLPVAPPPQVNLPPLAPLPPPNRTVRLPPNNPQGMALPAGPAPTFRPVPGYPRPPPCVPFATHSDSPIGGFLPNQRNTPSFWFPRHTRPIPNIVDSCAHIAMRELLGPAPEDIFPTAVILAYNMCPDTELARMADPLLGSSEIFLHALALQLGLDLTVEHHVAMGPNALTSLGLVGGRPATIHAVILADGSPHWQAAPPVRRQDTGPFGNSDRQLFVGGSSSADDLALSFFRDLTPAGLAPFQFRPNSSNAKLLFTEFQEHTLGKIAVLPKWSSNVKRFEAAVRAPPVNREISVLYLSGVAGSGKSADVRNVLQRRQAELSWFIQVVCPLAALNADWLSRFPGLSQDQRGVFKTHERALFSSPTLMILDEAQKFPGHYLDFAALTNPSLRYVILLGDPFQCGPAVVDSRSIIPADASPGIALGPFAARYLAHSWRVNAHVAAALQIPICHNVRSQVGFVTTVPKHLPVIVTTVASQNVQREYGVNAYTLSSCGGQDFSGSYTIVLTRELLTSVPVEAIYTAFTRSRSDIYVYNAMSPAQLNTVLASSALLNAILGGVALAGNFRAYLPNRIAPGSIAAPSPLFVARKLLSVSDVLMQREDPITKFDQLAPVIRASMLAPPAATPSSFEDNHIHVNHAPVVEGWTPSYFGQIPNPVHSLANSGFVREDVEFPGPPLGTQFDDSCGDSLRVEDLSDMFALHKSNDPALFKPTVEKRLRFSDHESNVLEFRNSSFLGPMLSDAFLEEAGLPDSMEWDALLFEECVADCASKRLAKSLAMLNNLERDQDPDLRDDFTVLNFLKAQLINKPDTITRFDEQHWRAIPKVKPAQMITTYSETMNAFFGPLTRYLAAAYRKHTTKPHVLMYGGMSLPDLDQWSRQHVPSTKFESFTNDYTAYDKSCRGDSLNFEVCIMRCFNVPDCYIDMHVELTTHLKSSMGTLGIMRTSGQWCTYLFNSWFNAAYFRLKYDYDLSTPRGYSGDDMFILCVPVQRPGWKLLSRYFALVGKPTYCRFPEFCGWILTCHGIVRHPLLMYLKLIYHDTHGSLPDVIINYYLEHCMTLRVGDQLHEVLDPALVEAFGSCVRFFSGHMSHIPKVLHAHNSVVDLPLEPATHHDVKLTSALYKADWRHIPKGLRTILLGL